jgi:hypothetical protein
MQHNSATFYINTGRGGGVVIAQDLNKHMFRELSCSLGSAGSIPAHVEIGSVCFFFLIFLLHGGGVTMDGEVRNKKQKQRD